MSKDPAVLFYTSDFLSGTSFMSYEQRGQYITLLCQQHQLGIIPKNHMICVCLSLDSPVVAKFAVDASGNYYNKRMREEHEKRASYCKSRSNNKSGRPKKSKNKISYDSSMIIHMENENDNENDNDNKDKFVKISFKPPSIIEVGEYCKLRGNKVDCEKWYNFYEAKGWMIGKNKMKDWKACIRTWEKNEVKNDKWNDLN